MSKHSPLPSLKLTLSEPLPNRHQPYRYLASTEELALFSVEKFAEEMDGLLDITLRSRLVEKMAMALFDCLFDDFGEKRGDDIKTLYQNTL